MNIKNIVDKCKDDWSEEQLKTQYKYEKVNVWFGFLNNSDEGYQLKYIWFGALTQFNIELKAQ